jgi:ABC-type antimicrobial peptide transport system permease subunit
MLLVETGPDPRVERELTGALRRELDDFGVEVVRTSDLLASYARVQNTYLSTFQTLGGLGLLLGTFGLVTVLVRNVLERRSELAMMLAVGFRPRWVVRMVLLENVLLLLAGVGVGTLAALAGALPQLLATQTHVNWPTLVTVLVLTIVVGMVSCALAARLSMRGRLVAALRAE